MMRAYFPGLILNSKQCVITDVDEVHHLKNVLRVKSGDIVSVFNGKGLQAQGVIEEISPKLIKIFTHNFEQISESLPRLILACAIPKNSKFELIVEKATELGVSEIVPLLTQRTEFGRVKYAGGHKVDRFKTVALNACKQCQRAYFPKIHEFTKFDKALDVLVDKSTVIIPSLMGERKLLKDVLLNQSNKNAFSFFIGPEGDFTPEEYALAFQKGCIPVTLGANILRVETAAISVMAFSQIFLK
ncbi:MAG: 16S rRNA (uracil(1498)-N(3))-methyltransferase [Candidatus Omnitrophica bacterium]|nr:16S rRNA (uracil(1498)-N(3))-methyltransferase [Candidatus Omnitrophota bacterium]